MPKQYVFQPVQGHSPLAPVTMPSLAAFDYLWSRVGAQISEWVCMKDDRSGKHVIAFFTDDAHAKGVAKIAEDILALLAAKEPAAV